jgi:hypothetical protein
MVVTKLKMRKAPHRRKRNEAETGMAKQMCAYLCPSAPHAMMVLESGSSTIS